ncbi:alpha-tocopherol transfer protein-like [Amyelois transitella]|uniref:alpha-tocopherol transfer protein-like n=1 Tax=Amyelois transitella TaxID=680683 RepID=UPI00067B73CB|nr:alpha-tocopherol transfer protein-like [Amyelois transitella]XP_013200526.1 alpha-tocopherol transfer protein-like [Amyelois transitella]
MIRELTPELAKIAEEELNEKPTQIADDLRYLKEWIAKQPHLIARTDDQWLVGLLRGCKFSLEKVKKKLDLYYTLKTTAPDITLRIKPTDPKFLDFLRLGTCVFLPKPKNQLYPRVLLIRPGAYDPEKNHVADIMCILYYLVQIVVLEDDVATVIGTRILVDYQGVTMSHFSQGTPTVLKKLVAVSQDSMPLRLKGSHHMNMPSGIEMIFTLISNFLNEKAKERLKIHKTHEDLFDFVPKEIIPSEYGGDGGTISEITEYWVSKMKEYKNWMQKEEQLGTDESKRLGQSLTKDNFSTEGSFRKLDID